MQVYIPITNLSGVQELFITRRISYCKGSSDRYQEYPEPIVISVAVLAEISLRSPRKLVFFIIKKIYLQDQIIQKQINLILKTASLIVMCEVRYARACSN